MVKLENLATASIVQNDMQINYFPQMEHYELQHADK